MPALQRHAVELETQAEELQITAVHLEEQADAAERARRETARLLAATAEGRRSLGAPGAGTIAAGEPADLLVLDLETLDRDRILPVEPLDLVFARGNAGHVRGLWVAGREVVRDGRVLGIDLDEVEGELRARYREVVASSPLLRVLPAYEAALRRWYLDRAGCC